MRPLLLLAIGLLLIWLRLATPGGLDLAPDPLGWILVILGLSRLPGPRLPLARGLAVLALLVSLPLAVPTLAERLSDADPSLGWAVSLPQLAAIAALLTHLAALATESEDPAAAGWLIATRTGVGVMAVLPILAFGAGSDLAGNAAAVVQLVVTLVSLALVLIYAERPWARGLADSPPDDVTRA